MFPFVFLGPEGLPSFAKLQSALWLQLTMTELCLVTATSPVLLGLIAVQLVDSVPAGRTLLDDSAQNVPQDTMDFHTADVSLY